MNLAAGGYGLPLRCPKCVGQKYFGMLKVPGNKSVPCPNCGTRLISDKEEKKRERT